MLVLVFSVQAVTHTGRLHRYLPSKGISSMPWVGEDTCRRNSGDAASSSVEVGGSSSSGGDTTTSGMAWGPPWGLGGLGEERRKKVGVFCGVLRGEWPEEEEEGRRWLSSMDILDSCLWNWVEAEDDAPGLWRERREEDRPSPNRGNNGKKEERRRQTIGGGGTWGEGIRDWEERK